jgi:crotonobetainyl-CoA:carnitine CoA-transferase CaiB-like acyl-CoA transferase
MVTGSTGPLAGVRVIDLGTVVAGPFAATLLADFGAEVIKVELPGRGDTLRQLGPVRDGASLWFAADARGKKSVTLDLRRPEGRDLLLRLATVADALVENFVPGTLDGWGLDAAALRAANPRLIVARASGYGQTGPYRKRPGYDRVGIAFGGLWHITGLPDGEPIRPGTSLADYLTGTFGALGIMLALYYRDARGGAAQEIDASLFESIFRVMEHTAVHYHLDGHVRGRTGNAGPAVPSGAFRTRDGRWLALAVAEDRMYARLMHAIGRPDFAEDPRYVHAPGRTADRAPIEAAIRDWIGARDAGEALDALHAAEIPTAETTTIADIFADPQYAARDAIATVEDPALGTVRMQGVTPKLSGTPGSIRRGAPLLGEHTHEVFGGLLGLSSAEIERLAGAGVL